VSRLWWTSAWASAIIVIFPLRRLRSSAHKIPSPSRLADFHILRVFHHQTHGSIPPRCLKIRGSFNSLAYAPEYEITNIFLLWGGFDPPVFVWLGTSCARDRYLVERYCHFTHTPYSNPFLSRMPVSKCLGLDIDAVFFSILQTANFSFLATRAIWRILHSWV